MRPYSSKYNFAWIIHHNRFFEDTIALQTTSIEHAQKFIVVNKDRYLIVVTESSIRKSGSVKLKAASFQIDGYGKVYMP